jgi:hypothetical protein
MRPHTVGIAPGCHYGNGHDYRQEEECRCDLRKSASSAPRGDGRPAFDIRMLGTLTFGMKRSFPYFDQLVRRLAQLLEDLDVEHFVCGWSRRWRDEEAGLQILDEI